MRLPLLSSPAWDSVLYWALDLETGGLDPRKDAILAVGLVPVRAGTIRLGESYCTLVRPEDGKEIDPESVRAHQLVWGEVRGAPPLAEVLPEIDRRLREGVLLVHHRALDVAFLRRAYARAGLRWPRPRVVDTVDLLIKAAERTRLLTPDLPQRIPTLNLSKVRQEYGLPEYQAHDALTDALAAAELFLVLRKKLRARTLRDLR
jgi:DNA polymerase-3 subunit epsilon